MFTLGIDVGSASSKVVILRDGRLIEAAEVIQLGTGSSGPGKAMRAAFLKTGLSLDEMDYTVVTGYGRFGCREADKQISEISCHAKGIYFLIPTARTIIDIGGQDAKVIKLDQRGAIRQFFMNDKCAAGTGRFLEVMSRVLEVELDEMAEYDLRATEPAAVSSTCTVFAESEVISQLSKGIVKENIVAGVHNSVAGKACGLVGRAGAEDDVVMCGGVSRDGGVVRAIARQLKRNILVAPDPQTTGALGAALFAYEEAMKQNHMKEERQAV